MERENRPQPELTNNEPQFTLEGGNSMDPQTEQQQARRGPRSQEGEGRPERVRQTFGFTPEVISELNKPDVDLDSAVLKNFFKNIEDSLDPNSRDFGSLARELAENGDINAKAKKLLFEFLVEEIISIPDPTVDSRYELGLNARSNLDTLKYMAYRFGDTPQERDQFRAYIGNLIEVREEAHELRRNLSSGELYKKLVAERLGTHALDVMRNEITGISDVESLYELFSTLRVAERDTHDWFTQGDIDYIDKQVEGTILGMVKAKKLIKSGRPLTEWEARRAISLGKTLFAGTQRFAMYAGLGDLPGGDVARVGSTPYEYIVRTIFGEKTAGARYFAGAASRAFQKKAFDYMDEVIKGTDLELFGIGQNTWKVNKLGALTPADQRWRSQLMYLGSIRLNMSGGPTLVDYLEKRLEEFGLHLDTEIGGHVIDAARGIYNSPHPEDYDPALGYETDEVWKDPRTGKTELKEDGKPKTREDKMKEYLSSGETADVILGQRLYLSNLVKYKYITREMKADLWRKIAIFDPLAFSALLPSETAAKLSKREREVWLGLDRRVDENGNKLPTLREKMARAALTRLRREEEEFYKGELNEQGKPMGLSYEKLKREADAFRAMTDGYKYQMIDRYFEAEDRLTPEEEALVKKMIDFGMANAEKMAKVDVPFAFAINDAPRVAWEKTGEGLAGLGRENLIRILASDQANLSEAWGEINSLIEHPVGTERLEKGPVGKEFAEHLMKFVDGYSRVHGRSAAQKIIRPFLKAWLDMATMYPHSTFVGAAEKGLRKPRSDFEKFYRVNFLALDEEARAALLDALAVMGIVSSDVSHGKADLEVLKEEHKADRKYLALKMFRELLLLFGPIVALELVKIFFPEEVSKGLGIKS